MNNSIVKMHENTAIREVYISREGNEDKIITLKNQKNNEIRDLEQILKKYFNTVEKIDELLEIDNVVGIYDNEIYNELQNSNLFGEGEWCSVCSVPECKVYKVTKKEIEYNFYIAGQMLPRAYVFVPRENCWYYNNGSGLKPLK